LGKGRRGAGEIQKRERGSQGKEGSSDGWWRSWRKEGDFFLHALHAAFTSVYPKRTRPKTPHSPMYTRHRSWRKEGYFFLSIFSRLLLTRERKESEESKQK
jgi:hypothetical protein